MKAAIALALLSASSLLYGQGVSGQAGKPSLRLASLGVYDLLTRMDVQDDLKLSVDVKVKFSGIRTKMLEQSMDANNSTGTPEEISAKMDAIRAEHQAQASALLTPEQKTRLRQIQLQLMGGAVILDPEVSAMLAFTPAQKAKIEKVGQDRNAEAKLFVERIKTKQMTPPKALAAMQVRYRELDDSLLKILDKEQSAKLRELLGPKFKAESLDGIKKPPARSGG